MNQPGRKLDSREVRPDVGAMHRDSLLKSIEEYASRFPNEGTVIDQFVEFIQSHSDCFERSLLSGHLTGAAWIVDSAGEQVLLTHHRKLDIWIQPGGHADGDSDMLGVALKEADEETGLEPLEPVTPAIFDLDIHSIPARGSVPEHLHYDVRYAIRHEGDGEYIVTDESHDLAWVPIDRLSDYTDEESIHRMAMKWQAGPRE